MTALGDENVRRLDVPMDDSLACAASRASAISMASERNNSVSSGRPAMRCFSVMPSRYSMAMKC